MADAAINISPKLGYYIGKLKTTNTLINHLIFIDDLKMYASNDNQLTTLINITKLFSDDIKKSFGFDKITTAKGKLTSTGDIELDENAKRIKQHQNLQIFRDQRKMPDIYERFKRGIEPRLF